MKAAKSDVKKSLVAQLRHVGLELNSLATEIEELGQLPKVESRIRDLPGLLDILQKAAWEIQQKRFEKASSIIEQINIGIAQEQLDELQVS
ncbi:hypothetical protein [Nostoc sp.]|uniref:hypothetical protein n=1 Tax=Nostoc sp. TaxID=1180 RepID=UPI002FF8D627